jgi:hypothetical protein
MRRDGPPTYGKRFFGNKDTKVVHDLDNEKPQCRINKIFFDGDAVVFTPDTLVQARREGFYKSHVCIEKSRQ